MQGDKRNDWGDAGFTVAICVIVGLAAYMTGYHRGERLGERTREVVTYVTTELPPPYAHACATMMEAAWEMIGTDLPPKLPDLPHNP